jgi:hypothetical protein
MRPNALERFADIWRLFAAVGVKTHAGSVQGCFGPYLQTASRVYHGLGFFGLTAHRRGNPFERVVQSLVFSVFVQFPVAVIRFALLGLGKAVAFGEWTDETALFYSFPIARGLGLAFA